MTFRWFSSADRFILIVQNKPVVDEPFPYLGEFGAKITAMEDKIVIDKIGEAESIINLIE